MPLKESVKDMLEKSREPYDCMTPLVERDEDHLLYNTICQLQSELEKVIDTEEEALATLVEEASTSGGKTLFAATMEASIEVLVQKRVKTALSKIITTLKNLYKERGELSVDKEN